MASVEVLIRDGHVQAHESVDLAFEGIRLELDQGRKKGTRLLLDGNIRGRAKPGRMLAIMGPSGAGASLKAMEGIGWKVKCVV